MSFNHVYTSLIISTYLPYTNWNSPLLQIGVDCMYIEGAVDDPFRCCSRERPPPTSLRQRRASVPRVNGTRATFRSKPNFVPPKNFFVAGHEPRRAAKSPQQFLDELRSAQDFKFPLISIFIFEFLLFMPISPFVLVSGIFFSIRFCKRQRNRNCVIGKPVTLLMSEEKRRV